MRRHSFSFKSKRPRGAALCVPSRLALSLCKWTSKTAPQPPSILIIALADLNRYVDEILQSTGADVDQVVVEPSGTWSRIDNSEAVRLGGATPTTDDDDDLIEISESRLNNVKQEPMASSILLEQTPAQSREASTPSSVARLSSKKRPAAQVIDLTGSDEEDEDESPGPPLKRPALNHTSRGLSSQDFHQPVTSSPLNGQSYPPSR